MLSAAPYAFGMSRSGRYVVGQGEGSRVPDVLYDRSTGTTRNFTLPEPALAVVEEENPYVVTDLGHLVLYEELQTPREYLSCLPEVCAFGVLDLSSNVATALGSPPNVGISYYPLALNTAGTKVFYLEFRGGRWTLLVRTILAG